MTAPLTTNTELPALEDLPELTELLARHLSELADEPAKRNSVRAGSLYCTRCGGRRRVSLQTIHPAHKAVEWLYRLTPTEHALRIAPWLLHFECTQCEASGVGLIFNGPTGREVAWFSETGGGLATPQTPPGVRHYLEEAHRAECVGAFSAALVMYRAALEFLLYQQGYTKRNLQPKISALIADQGASTAKRWVRDLDPRFLTVIQKLGNHAIHPNDGDIGKQADLDRGLVAAVRATFEELLDAVYEAEGRREVRLAKLIQPLETEGQASWGERREPEDARKRRTRAVGRARLNDATKRLR